MYRGVGSRSPVLQSILNALTCRSAAAVDAMYGSPASSGSSCAQ